MYDKKKHTHLTEEKSKERHFSHVLHSSTSGKSKGRHGKKIGGYKSVAGRGFRTK